MRLQNVLKSDDDNNCSSKSVTMVFIFGVNFVETKLIKKSLETFFALGPQSSSRILAKFSIHPRARVGDLNSKTQAALTAELTNMTIETDARRRVTENILRLKDMGSYRGRRHAMGLPVRGQRTRSQIQTSRKLNKVNRFGAKENLAGAQ